MLDILGDEYIVMHIMSTYKKEQEEKLFRTYLGDALYVISHEKSALSRKYSEIANEIFSSGNIIDDEKTADEIKTAMLKKLNGRG